MSATDGMRRTLDELAARGATELTEARAGRAYAEGLRKGLPLLAILPALAAWAQFGRWLKDQPPYVLPLVVVALLAAAAPFAFAWFRARAVRKRGVARDVALGALDERARLEGRLLAADEFTTRGARSSFESAAIEDAEARADAARRTELSLQRTPVEYRRPALAWGTLGVLLLALTYWLSGLERTAHAADPTDAVAVANADGVEPTADAPRTPPAAKAPVPEALTPEPARKSGRTSDPQDAEAAPKVTQDAKESSGKTGAGRSSGAMSSSAASQSKSAPSSAGQKSDPSKETPKPKAADEKKPKDDASTPEPQERPEDEQSGATAGKGSSKGSNKNPTASEWTSRDQVTDVDDQEVEDDEDTDEDEEEQENRGGVQPSLRDRRPPVSRDLQIGFGNRPSPDANGRGGPSEQKKSRGVASLVLGVPIPDRIKGRPGPGPTKITQERIEPETEDAKAIDGAGRRAREGRLRAPSALRLDGSLQDLVRAYFLAQRARP